MKITKYLHSCLLLEENNTSILIDPGIFTYNENVLNLANITKLDYLLITHSHSDHFHMPFVKEIMIKFPNVQIITNPDVASLLGNEHIIAKTTGNEFINLAAVQHEKIFFGEVPQNTLFTVFDELIHPGDSLSFQESATIFALPIQAPWGSTTWAVETAIKLKPQVIIPIHDYQWKDEVRIAMYDRLEEYFKEVGIEFKKPETGIPLEIQAR